MSTTTPVAQESVAPDGDAVADTSVAPSKWFARFAPIALVLLVTAVSVTLRLRSPAFLMADAGHDDQLFAKLAGNIVDGNWLGPYDQLTLAKGPGYPIFIATVFEAHLPLKLAEHVVHLLAAALAAWAGWRASRSAVVALSVYAVVALDPAYLGEDAAGLNRSGLYGSVSLILVAVVFVALTYVPGLVGRGWKWSIPAVAVFGAAIGLLVAFYYILREERQWLAPAVAMAVVAGIVTWRGDRRTHVRGAAVTALMCIVGVAFGAGALHEVSARNERFYGTSVISDLVDGDIADAYAQWQRVPTNDERRYFPVDRSQRAAVYRISPAAAELAPFLEDPENKWRLGCPTCDLKGDYFVWAIRDAAGATGHETSGAEAQRFFGQIADDIERACETELECTAPGIGPMPPWNRFEAGRVWSSGVSATKYLLSFHYGEPERVGSGGIEPSWQIMIKPLRGLVARDQAEYRRDEARAIKQQEGVSFLTDLYRFGARFALLPALVGFVLAIASRAGRRRPAVFFLSLAMLTAAASRIALLALTDALSFRGAATTGVYMLPGVDFLLVFLVLGCWSLVHVIRDYVQRTEAPLRPIPHGTTEPATAFPSAAENR